MMYSKRSVTPTGLVAKKTTTTTTRTIHKGTTKGSDANPTHNHPGHEGLGASWITYKTSTRRMRKLCSSSQNTMERKVQQHNGTQSNWVDDFPPLATPIAKENIVCSEIRVLPAKDVKTPVYSLQPPSSSNQMVVIQNSKCVKEGKKEKKMSIGGGNEEGEKEDDGLSKRMRFAKTVKVRLFGLDSGNDNTHRRVMTNVLGDDVTRLTKATRSTGHQKTPSTDEAQEHIDRANTAISDWSFPSANSTYESVSIDSARFRDSDESGDGTLGLYDESEMDDIFEKEMFDPDRFQQLPMNFNIFEQMPMMNDREWWYETEKICEESQKPMPSARYTDDVFLGQDAIFAGLLKTLKDTGSSEYAIGYPIDIELDYTVEALRANIVRKPDAQWILQPILIQRHWILGCYNPSTSRVIIYDSLYHGYTKARKDLTVDWVQLLFEEIVDDNNVKLSIKFARRDYSFHQHDGYNCGVFVLLHAQRFMNGRRKLVGRPEDVNINLTQERRNLLGLMKCMERYLDSKYHYDDPVQQYDQNHIDWSFVRQLRRSPRNITTQLQNIRDCVAELNKGRCRTVRKRKRVPVPAPNTTVIVPPAGLTSSGSHTLDPDSTSDESSLLVVPPQSTSSDANGSPLSQLDEVTASPTRGESPEDMLDLDTSAKVTKKRRLVSSDTVQKTPANISRVYSSSDEDNETADMIPQSTMEMPQPSARELRISHRLSRIEEDERNGGQVRKGTKRRRRGEDDMDDGNDGQQVMKRQRIEEKVRKGTKRRRTVEDDKDYGMEDGRQDMKKQRMDPGPRGHKRRSMDDDNDARMKRRRDEDPSDDKDRNVTRRGARATRRRSSGTPLIGSRQ